MKKALIILLAAVYPAAGACPEGSVKEKDRPEQKDPSIELEKLISFESGPEIFPESWRNKPFFSRAAPVKESEKDRARKAIVSAMAKYPLPLVQKTINRVYLIGKYEVFKGQTFSGTASHRDVYLVVDDASKGYTDQFIARTFHREYSTLLLNRFLKHLDQKAWAAVNPPDFKYAGGNSWDRIKGKDGGAKAIDSGKISLRQQSGTDFLKYGFLTEYSRSSLENDFNEYAGALFTGTEQFWKNVDRYPGTAAKCRIAIGFYEKLDPTLTEEYFRKLK